jgi:hypothetical protein
VLPAAGADYPQEEFSPTCCGWTGSPMRRTVTGAVSN